MYTFVPCEPKPLFPDLSSFKLYVQATTIAPAMMAVSISKGLAEKRSVSVGSAKSSNKHCALVSPSSLMTEVDETSDALGNDTTHDTTHAISSTAETTDSHASSE